MIFFYYFFFFYLQANKQHSEREKYFVPVCQTRHFVKVGGTKQWECWEGKLNSISCLGVTARRSWVMLPGKQFLRFHCSLSRSITALLNEHLNGHNCRATESGKNSFFDTTENARNYTPDRKLSAIASPALLQFYCKPALSWNQYGKISMNPRVTNHTATGFTWKKKKKLWTIYLPSHMWFRLQARVVFQNNTFRMSHSLSCKRKKREQREQGPQGCRLVSICAGCCTDMWKFTN